MRIAVLGPESSGKTTLSQGLADHFDWNLIPEFSRKYLNNLDRPYIERDLCEIAIGQFEDILNSGPDNSIISDTEMITIKIWAIEKYGSCDEKINDLLLKQKFDLYLLCYPDLKWEYDILRESPNKEDRMRQFDLFKNELQSLNADFVVIKGNGNERLEEAVSFISKRFK